VPPEAGEVLVIAAGTESVHTEFFVLAITPPSNGLTVTVTDEDAAEQPYRSVAVAV
jgi:hypothetical protein